MSQWSDEVAEARSLVQRTGDDPSTFTFTQLDPSASLRLEGEYQVLVTHGPMSTTYEGGHARNWMVEFELDLKQGMFEPSGT